MDELENTLGTIEEVVDDLSGKEQVELVPTMRDYGWHDYVMKHFQPEELIDNRPTVDGLWRVSQILIGEIVSSKPKTIQAPRFDESGRLQPAVVEWTIKFYCNDDKVKIFGDVADIHPQNCLEVKYLVHASSTAATKARARALRQALGLRKTIAAEEVANIKEEEVEMRGTINDSQKSIINLLCKNTNINPSVFINSGSKTYGNINDIPFELAAKMIKELSRLQSTPSEIKEKFKGYDPDWLKNYKGF